MATIFYSISHSSMAIIILLYLFQITVLSLKKNILHACSSRTFRPLLRPRPLSTQRIPGYPTLVPGPCVIGSTVWEASSKNRQNCTEFDAPSMMFPYFTPSYPTRKFSVRLAVDKYLRASTQSSSTGEKPKFLWPASGSWKPDSSKNLTEEGSLSFK